jgi:hypothetical protein
MEDHMNIHRIPSPGDRRRRSSLSISNILFHAAASDDSILISGLEYYAKEYEDMIEGTIYEKWSDDGSVIPMRWERVSSMSMNIFVTMYMNMKGCGNFLIELRDKVIVPSGWSLEITDPGPWKEKDGKKYSVIKLEIERS